MKRREFLAGIPTGYSLMMLGGRRPRYADDTRPPISTRIAPPENLLRMAREERHMRLVELETDVLVAGGGLAGVCAAIAAARHGARVVLVQDRSRLGGNSSSEVKMHVVGANCHNGRPGWRESGLIEEFRLDDAVNNPQRCWELWDLLLYDKVVSEPNITLLLETVLYAATVKDGRIDRRAGALRQERAPVPHPRQDLLRLHRRFAARRSRPARRCAPAAKRAASSTNRWRRRSPTTRTLGSSILFTSRLYHKPDAVHAAEVGAQGHQGAAASIARSRVWEYGYWWIEWGGDHDIIARQRAHPFRAALDRDGRLGLHQEQRRFSGLRKLGPWTGWA